MPLYKIVFWYPASICPLGANTGTLGRQECVPTSIQNIARDDERGSVFLFFQRDEAEELLGV